MENKTLLVLCKYINFIKLYDNKLSNSSEDKAIHFKNIKLLSNLNITLNTFNSCNLLSDDFNDINYLPNTNLSYLKFCQSRIKNSLPGLALKLRRKDFDLKKDYLIFSLISLIEFSKITKDYLKLEDIFKTIDSLNIPNDANLKLEKNSSCKKNTSIYTKKLTDLEDLDDI